VVYVVTEAGVFKSLDNGLTWESLSQQLERRGARTMAIDPLESDTLCLALGVGEGKSELHKSTNGGESWQPINDGLDVAPGVVNNVANNLDIDAEGRYLYLGTGGRRVYRADLRQLNLEKN